MSASPPVPRVNTRTDTDIIIIGAGIAGLAAGCYAQMNGYRTQIFERHSQSGGLCTAWQREEYTFDGCIHYLFGTGPGQPFHTLWQALGAVQGRDFFHPKELMRVTEPGGRTLIAYAHPDQLEAHLLALSPADRRLIKAFCSGIRTFTQFDLSLLQQQPRALMGLSDWIYLCWQMLPFAGPMARWGRLSARAFARQFKHPFLRRAIPYLFSWPDIPVVVGMLLLAYMHNQNAGLPLGGSLAFARAIERRYRALGGIVHYSAQVERVLIQRGRAVGVRLYSTEEYFADRVISACDGHSTVFSLLRDMPVPTSLRRRYDGRLPVRSQLQVSLGLNRDLSNAPHWTTFLLNCPVRLAGEERHTLDIKHYCHDRSLSPPGKSVMIVMMTSPYDYWQHLYGRTIYHDEENHVSAQVVAQLERLYPGLKADIDAVDVATPLSYERYTGNWQGSSCGWLLTRRTLPLMIKGLSKTLPKLRNFYMVGQWVEPGGSLPVVATSGRNTIQQICHEDRRDFRTLLP
ncbi:MAG: NAD(P)/FAD-dependent oxidoreductase [Cyanobacteria bacterium J06648_16]